MASKKAKKATKKAMKAIKAPARKAPKKAPPAKAAKKAARKTTATAKKAAPRKAKGAAHQIVHWEIQAQNPDLLHNFYAEALGWEIDANNDMKYGMVSSGGDEGINGGIGGKAPGDTSPSRVLVYASVPSIPEALERIEALGGKTLMPRTDIGVVIMALYADPEGNTMGLLEG